MKQREAVLVSCCLMAAAAGARAQDAAASPPPVWTGEAGLSYVQTGGNTQTQTIGTSARLTHEGGVWKAEAQAAFLRAEASDEVTAKKWTALAKGSRALGDRLGAYGQTTFLRDVFAGIERENAFDLGGILKVLSGPRQVLDATATVAFTDESRLGAEDRSFLGGRLGAAYKLKLAQASELAVEADYLQGFSDADASRARTAVSITSALGRILALKVTHKLAWVKEPVPGKDGTDTELLASIVARWPPAP
jgi:putative salt-induced outer membrane protein YdiY